MITDAVDPGGADDFELWGQLVVPVLRLERGRRFRRRGRRRRGPGGPAVYQTAPSDPAAAMTDTTSAAMTMTAKVASPAPPGTPARDFPGMQVRPWQVMLQG
jgi:hypothetical protein